MFNWNVADTFHRNFTDTFHWNVADTFRRNILDTFNGNVRIVTFMKRFWNVSSKRNKYNPNETLLNFIEIGGINNCLTWPTLYQAIFDQIDFFRYETFETLDHLFETFQCYSTKKGRFFSNQFIKEA